MPDRIKVEVATAFQNTLDEQKKINADFALNKRDLLLKIEERCMKIPAIPKRVVIDIL